jgi:hypothetical protein
MTMRPSAVLVGTALGGLLLVVAHLLISTTFMFYDDEGYVLQSYRAFAGGGRLYDEIFTQYGPWPYVYHWLASLGSVEILTHSFGRALTMWHWILCSLLCGNIAWQTTKRTSAAAGTTLLVFGYLRQMVSEPSHPGSLICAVLSLAATATLAFQSAGRWRLLGVTSGMATALLLLTKINVGLFLLAGTGAIALLYSAWSERWKSWAGIAALTGLLLLPWTLMARQLTDKWVLSFAILFSLAATGTWWILVARKTQTQPVPFATWKAAAATLGCTTLAVVLFPWLQGTSGDALLQGVLLAPLRMPAHFVVESYCPPWIWPLAIACAVLTARAGWELRQAGAVSRLTCGPIHVVRTAALLFLLLNFRTWLTNQGQVHFLVLCLPLAPLFLVRTQGKSGPADPNLAWLVLLALPQVLHAYPVAGTQKSWGTFLLLPLFVAGWTDTWQCLMDRSHRLPRMVPGLGHAILPLLGLLQLSLLFQTGWQYYRSSRPLGLPGAENLRPPAMSRLVLRTLTLNAALHADVLFSRPGMFSYNLWSGVPTPTAQNATHWFWLLDKPAQQAIITRLRETPRSALIVSRQLDELVTLFNVPMSGPLYDYVQARFRPLFELPMLGLQFLIPQESRAVPFGLVELFTSQAEPGPSDRPILLQTNVALDGKLHAVNIQAIESPWHVYETFTPGNARLVLEPITTQGENIGPAIELPLSAPVRGLFRLNLYLSRRPACLDRSAELILTGTDSAGEPLSESLF